MSAFSGEESYAGLPQLAGLCEMKRAVQGDWSLDESVRRLKRLHYVLRRLHEILTSRITAVPIYEWKTALSYHAYLLAEQVQLIRTRVSEMREPPLGLDQVPHAAIERLLDELECVSNFDWLASAVYRKLVPAVIDACDELRCEAHPLADAPTVRIAKLMAFELAELTDFAERAALEDGDESLGEWLSTLDRCMAAAGGVAGTEPESGEIPEPEQSRQPFVFQSEPQRDERFQDSFNAGVNPEAFLYSEEYSAQDKTLMMYYKRIRELDVPEMMASILVELRGDEPWEFHMEMSRQLWDEARHAMMGEVGFVSLGLDWRTIPINFTWSRNLNGQLTARERHGVLFYIEQGLMPKTGKRFEWEVASESGDELSRLFQDFDWADEVLHAQIGRRWYVPKFKSLGESLEYGDRCWSKVLSHWKAYRDQGLTQHRNWWPELYRAACEHWGKEPEESVLAFDENYEDSRADLQSLGDS